MTATFASIKLPVSLVDDARHEGAVMSRSIAGQVEHWARLGQALEAAPGFTADRVRAALAGRLNAEDLTEDEWALFEDLLFVHPSEQERRAFAALGAVPGAVGMDDDGRIVRAPAVGDAQLAAA